MPDDYCLMAPAEDGFSSISDVDFATLKISEITPAVAGQWLFNVKAFSIERHTVVDYVDPTTTDLDYTTTIEVSMPEISFSGAKQGLRLNPQLEFFPTYDENQKLKPNVNNSLVYRYNLDSEAPYLQGFYFVKNRAAWYIGVAAEGSSALLYPAPPNDVEANINSIILSFVEENIAATVTTTFTLTITETFY